MNNPRDIFKDPKIQRMFESLADDFSIERDNVIIADSVKGTFCSKDYPDSIQTVKEKNITENDWMIHNETGRRYFIDNVRPLSSGLMLHYISENNYKNQSSQNLEPKVVNDYSVNIQGNVTSSNLNSPNASIYIENDFDKIKDLLLTNNQVKEQDKEQMIEFATVLIETLKSNQPIKKGLLAQFGDLVKTYLPVIINTVGQPLITWLITK